MSRIHFLSCFAAIWLTAFVVDSAQAQYRGSSSRGVLLTGGTQPSLLPPQTNSTPARQVGMVHPHPGQPPMNHHQHLHQHGYVHSHGLMMNQYPQTGAPLYPSPRPNIPHQVGGTMITNQALYPHEMLYPHKYKAMYPPFYYKVDGGWYVTPWGIRNSETWKLTGTCVDVKYNSRISPFSGFNPFRR